MLRASACVLQIGYSTVFFFEYFGPMVIYPLFFLFPAVFYGK
jgi:very-long-chain enoyl-CoA reductase